MKMSNTTKRVDSIKSKIKQKCLKYYSCILLFKKQKHKLKIANTGEGRENAVCLEGSLLRHLCSCMQKPC